ncbi:cytochrome P450 3A24-like isoform X2 [Haliotis rubra]|uniref:cytochrome P450 3A24-like isoform X2 n=1 Tax=Haliotis rubra TaxID=36100 RepID=UPI001EE54916|nr:cytochrome P450 3A24-like isoform X2 [Haliotis rubra]
MEILGCVDISPTWILWIAVLFLIYAYGKKRNRLFKDAGIPGPEPVIYIGNFHQFVLKGPNNKDWEKYGKVFGIFIGRLPMIIVMDPNIARDILIKEFHHFPERLNIDLNNYPINKSIFLEKGANWKRLRNIVSPTFSGSKLRLMCDQINKCADILTNNFGKAAESTQSIDVKRYFGAFTMDAIASTALGIEVDSQSDFRNVFVEQAQKLLQEGTQSPIIMITFLFPELTPLFKALGVSYFPKSSLKFFTRVLKEMIEQRKADLRDGKPKRQDFFQLLMDAEDDGTDDNPSQSGSQSKKMTNDEIIGQALLFFIAGYAGTAKTLHFVAYSLATQPNVQQRLTEEVDLVLGDKTPDYDNIGGLKYMDHVIMETLRMYPPSTILTRKVAETVAIKGYTFPKGSSIHIPIIGIHYDPDVYPDPTSLKPDRWERKSEMDPISYLPFGHGPRQCVGMRLAQLEMKMALARSLQKIQFVPADDTLTSLGMDDITVHTGTLHTKKPIMLKVKVRSDK